MSLRASSLEAGVPPRRDRRSGASATNPSFASCSVVWRIQSDRPKISWITTTPGARSLRHHEQPHRAAPAGAAGELPAGHEVLDRGGPAALHTHPHHLRAGRDGAVPGAVIRHERIALVRRREHRARVECEPERRRVGRVRDRRRLDPGAVEARIFRVRLAREIALRAPVPRAILEDVDVLGGGAVAAAGKPRQGRGGRRRPGVEPLHGRLLGEVHRVAAEREAERAVETAQHGLGWRVGDAVAVRVHEPDDRAGTRERGEHGPAGTECERAHPAQPLREEVDVEAALDVQRAARDQDRVLARGRRRALCARFRTAGEQRERDQHVPGCHTLTSSAIATPRRAGRSPRYGPRFAYTPTIALSPGGILARLASASSAARSTWAVTAASTSLSCRSVCPSCFRYSSYRPTGSRLPQAWNISAGGVSPGPWSSCVRCPPLREVSANSQAGPLAPRRAGGARRAGGEAARQAFAAHL